MGPPSIYGTRHDVSKLAVKFLRPFSLTHTLVTIALLTISTSRNTIINIIPNGFPAARLTAKRDLGDDTPVNYVQVGGDCARTLGVKRHGLSYTTTGS